eukprot:5978090-Pleurochrysis_carterae.AAC.2
MPSKRGGSDRRGNEAKLWEEGGKRHGQQIRFQVDSTGRDSCERGEEVGGEGGKAFVGLPHFGREKGEAMLWGA